MFRMITWLTAVILCFMLGSILRIDKKGAKGFYGAGLSNVVIIKRIFLLLKRGP